MRRYKTFTVALLVLATIAPINAHAGIVVVFGDSVLEECVRKALDIPSRDLLASDLEGLTSLTCMGSFNSHQAPFDFVVSLSGLEYATSLATLDLRWHSTVDLTPLQNLTSLTDLDLSRGSGLEDLTPLQNLTRLTHLILGSGAIEDLTPLENLTSLTELTLEGTLVEDLTPLENLTSLKTLNLAGNSIEDVAPLQNLASLRTLNLAQNFVEDFTPLQNLASLRELDLRLNSIVDITPLQNLAGLTELSLADNFIVDITPLQNLFSLTNLDLGEYRLSEQGNRIVDITPLQNLTSLTILSLSFNFVADLSPFEDLTNLTYLNLEYNHVVDITPLQSVINLIELRMEENDVVDITALQGLTSLEILSLRYNAITDIVPLRDLTQLSDIDLYHNLISDISPLVDNLGIAVGDRVTLSFNPLTQKALCTDIPLLYERVDSLVLGGTSCGRYRVPDLVGVPQALAEKLLEDMGLIVGLVTFEASDTFPVGVVTRQGRAANVFVSENTVVDLVISTGPTPVAVPDVVGLSESDAELAIIDAGFTVGTVTLQITETVPVLEVISQSPIASDLALPATAVNLIVSAGTTASTVPDVEGLARAAAETAIINAGLTVGTLTFVPHGSVPAGDVIRQDPTATTLAGPGSSVDLIVSLGPAVPYVVGMLQSVAEPAIVNAGLIVGTVTLQSSPTFPVDRIISQEPKAATLVTPGSPVDLVVSTGPVFVLVPDVVGMSQATAELAILDAGLTVGAVTLEPHDTVPAGDVITQGIVSGTTVVEDTPVDLLVSKGPAVIFVDASFEACVRDALGNAKGEILQSELLGLIALDCSSQGIGDISGLENAINLMNLNLEMNEISEITALQNLDGLRQIYLTYNNIVSIAALQNLASVQAIYLNYNNVVDVSPLVVNLGVDAGDTLRLSDNPLGQNALCIDIPVLQGRGLAELTFDGKCVSNETVVPNVVGLSEAAAEAAIVGAALTVGTVTLQFSDSVPEGEVISQNPLGGVSVVEDTPVDFVVSAGAEFATVPNVLGLSQSGAEAAIVSAELVVGTVSTQASDTVPIGDVISQSPPAESAVDFGSAVDLVVSSGPEPELCSVMPDVLEQLTLFRDTFSAVDDLDADGIPEDFILALVQVVACMDAESPIGIATLNAYDLNLMAFDAETDAGELAAFRELIATLMFLSQATQDAVRAILADPDGLELNEEYVIVLCDGTESCTPSAIKGTPLSDAYLTFDPAEKTINEPYSGSGNLDGDDFTNLEEYDNVIDAGGTADDFAMGASDPMLDGSEGTSGCGAGSTPANTRGGLAVFGLLTLALLGYSRRAVPRMDP